MPWRRRRVRADETLVAPPPAQPVQPVQPGAPVGPPPPEYAPPPREWWPWMLALLILVLAGLLAGWLLTRDNDKEANGETTVVVTRATTGDTATTQTTTTTAAKTVAVANVVGQKSAQAVEAIRGQGLEPVVVSVFSDQPTGVVVAQAPAAGVKAAAGSEVRVNVSKGAKNVEVPNVVGIAAADAAQQLQAAGLAANTVEVPSSEPKGNVVAQSPPAGQQAPGGTKVRLNVSNGRPAQTQTTPPATTAPATTSQTTTAPKPPPAPAASVTVPDLVGQNRKTAAEQIRSLRLVVTIRYVPAADAVGTVVSQSPAAGTTRKPGEGVLINLSYGPGGEDTAKTVPGVVGKTQAQATSILQGAGFVVEVWRLRVSKPSQNGIVVDEQPSGTLQAPAGSTITITVGSTSG